MEMSFGAKIPQTQGFLQSRKLSRITSDQLISTTSLGYDNLNNLTSALLTILPVVRPVIGILLGISLSRKTKINSYDLIIDCHLIIFLWVGMNNDF
jgi:hypothetical protein